MWAELKIAHIIISIFLIYQTLNFEYSALTKADYHTMEMKYAIDGPTSMYITSTDVVPYVQYT